LRVTQVTFEHTPLHANRPVHTVSKNQPPVQCPFFVYEHDWPCSGTHAPAVLRGRTAASIRSPIAVIILVIAFAPLDWRSPSPAGTRVDAQPVPPGFIDAVVPAVASA
jgi:hypothetical protein